MNHLCTEGTLQRLRQLHCKDSDRRMNIYIYRHSLCIDSWKKTKYQELKYWHTLPMRDTQWDTQVPWLGVPNGLSDNRTSTHPPEGEIPDGEIPT